MEAAPHWKAAVTIVRGAALRAATPDRCGLSRATAFDFTGAARSAWIGMVRLQPSARTGPHHHGRHEVAVYVASGHAEIRWGCKLEFAAEVTEGDFVHFAPYVPHEERNPDEAKAVTFVVVRSDNERITVPVAIEEAV